MKKPKKEEYVTKAQAQRERKRTSQRKLIMYILISLVISVILFFTRPNDSWIARAGYFVGIVIALSLNNNFQEKLRSSARVKKIEALFPDFLQLVSSNLRAGMTIDRSMLLSAREEFDPLDKEILKAGRDITTGKEIDVALISMAERIGSEKIAKIIQLIISGIESGGDMARLLEETAQNMRNRLFLEKKAASSVLMYVIFIFVAVAVGAPALFALSNILVEVLTSLLGTLPDLSSVAASGANTPFTLSSVNISTTFIFYFSIVFMLGINLLASLVLGLVSKGEEREGLKFFIPITIISMVIFLSIKFLLAGTVQDLIG